MRAFPGKLVVSIWCFYSHVLGSVPQDTKRGQKKKKRKFNNETQTYICQSLINLLGTKSLWI